MFYFFASAGSAIQAFRRALANATSILFRVCESEGDGTRFVEIRADSWFLFFK